MLHELTSRFNPKGDAARRRFAAVAFAGALLLACATRPAGLELIITTDLKAPDDYDTLQLQVSQEGTSVHDDIPFTEPNFPVTFAIAAGRLADQEAIIDVSLLKAGSIVVARQAQVQVPKDRVAELTLVLGRKCVAVTCEAGETCDPQPDVGAGACVPIVVDPSALPTFTPADVDAAVAMVTASGEKEGEGGPTDADSDRTLSSGSSSSGSMLGLGSGSSAEGGIATEDGASREARDAAPKAVPDAESNDVGTAGTGASTVIADGGSDGETSQSTDGEDSTTALVVSIPGPDGGPLPSGDGGPLLGELIDDIDSESMAGWIPIRSGRVGTWFTYSDGTAGGVVPAASSPPAQSVGTIIGWNGNPNNLAAHVSGNGLSLYAGIGFYLNAYNLTASTYDASAYRGFVFWGRVGGDSGTTSVRFAVPDKNTSAAGGVCTAASEGGAAGCSDYFSKGITLTPSWQQFVIDYTQLQQTGFGLPKGLTGLDAAHIYSCQFQLSPGAPFDIWIDDIYFIDP